MRQILLSVVFVLSGVAQINAHHTDRETFGALYTKADTVSRYFNDNPSKILEGCGRESVVLLLRNILNGVPSDVSLHLFNKEYTGTLFSAKDAHAYIYAEFLNNLHLSVRGQSKPKQDGYKMLGDATDSSGDRIYMTKSEQDIIATTYFACGLIGRTK